MIYLENIESFLGKAGYTLTTIGTLVGIIALVITFKVNNKTNEIKENVERIKFLANFNSTRLEVIQKSKEVHSQYKEKGNFLNFEIKEIIIDLEAYRELYTVSMEKLLDTLKQQDLLLKDKTSKPSKKEMDNLVMQVYTIQRKLESNLDIFKESKGELNG